MKTFTLTLLFSLSALFAMAYSGNTYTIFGKTYTFANKIDQGDNDFVYDLYTIAGENKAVVVALNEPWHPLYQKARYNYAVPSEIEYNGKTYTITKIADKAFSTDPSSLKTLVIPPTVTEIGDSAFYNLKDLSMVTIGDGVTRIGNGAFSNCIGLISINFPSSLDNIGRYIIQGCERLKCIEWDINPHILNVQALAQSLYVGYSRTTRTVITKTRAQAQDAKHFFENVVCYEDKAYIESLENTISDKDKAIAENNTMAENLVSQYTMLQQESQILQSHNNNLNNCDVNQDGQVNGTDVVTIYNRIIQGGSSYNGQYYVDLGLPSGTLWATCNVGAPSPECVGDYFAWGENGFYSYRYGLAFGKVEFTEDTYKPAPGVEDIVNGEWPQEYSPLKVIYIAQWDGWKIPTYNQAKELTNNCTNEIVTVNGQECLELTSKINKRKIYFPLNGKIDGTSAKETNEVFYWTSTTGSSKYYAYIIPFQLHSIFLSEDRYLGMGIRPVITKDDITE